MTVDTPIWEQRKLDQLDNESLLQQAVQQNVDFCISPFVYAEIVRRGLAGQLQFMVNPAIACGAWTRSK